MFARSALRRWAATPVRRVRTLNAFGAFLQATKGEFTGPFKARVRAVTAAWRRLTPNEKRRLAAAGAKVRIVATRKVRKARPMPPFAAFVKRRYGRVRHLPASERMAALARRFHQRHGAK